MEPFIQIEGRRIGTGYPVYIVAEMSANHQQDYKQAVELVRTAKRIGADAIKLQTYTPDTLTIQSDEEAFRISGGTSWDGKTLYALYGEAYTPWEWQPKLKALADDLGITLFSSAFDASAVDFLEDMGVPAYKVASFEIVDIPLLERLARTRKPLILSTGLSTIEEIEEAVRAAAGSGATQIALLKCTSAYPAPVEEMNLRGIQSLRDTFDIPVGLSDHTLSIATPVAAVSLGASIVEKHLTLSRDIPGPDSAFSLEPDEFAQMVEAVHTAEKALGEAKVGRTPAEEKSLIFRRSLYVVEDMRAGEAFTEGNVRSIRPGYGLHTRHFKEVLGRRAARDVKRGTPMSWDLVA